MDSKNQAISDFARTVKNSWIVPEPFEIVAFVFFMILFIILCTLFHYSSIQAAVKKRSRCMRDRSLGASPGGIYTVMAQNNDNQPLYKVDYNLSSREFAVKCACPEGTVSNRFPSIPVFNLGTQTEEKIKDKTCGCDTKYFSTGDSIHYSGYPGLVSYMNSGNTSFFDAAFSNGYVKR